MIALLPIITPPFVVGLGLILLFGRAGVVNQFLEVAFGIPPTRWFYGWFGVWLAQTFAFTPIAFMIMRGVVQGVAPSLEEAAQTLRASPHKTFMTVTLPLLKPGLANAFLVGFIESMADFGNPIVVGGQFSVLSTEIFFAIVGAQYDQGVPHRWPGCSPSLRSRCLPSSAGCWAKQSFTTVSGRAMRALPCRCPRACAGWCIRLRCRGWRSPSSSTCLRWLAACADLGARLHHHAQPLPHGVQCGMGRVRHGVGGHGVELVLHHHQAGGHLGAAHGRAGHWHCVAAGAHRVPGQGAFEFSALLAFAIPGTVLGVSYILAFNVPPFELTGTALVIVLCFMFRNLPVGVRAGTAAFKQLDRSLDEASVMLRAGSLRRRCAMWCCLLLKPALVAALVYSFVRAITTVSAVIFLVTAENELATTYIIGRVGNGDYGVALAYCTVLILLMSASTGLIQWLVGDRKLGRRGSTPESPSAPSPQGGRRPHCGAALARRPAHRATPVNSRHRPLKRQP